MPWSGDKSGIPENAVIGGGEWGKNLYFARHDLTYGGHFRGKLVGSYDPLSYTAKIPFDGKQFEFTEFEVSFALKLRL